MLVNSTTQADNDRKAYKAEKAREYRKKDRELQEENRLPLRESAVREALADAAMIILRKDFDGAFFVQRYLEDCFKSTPMYAISSVGKIKQGKIKPKHLRIASGGA